jgi:predicted metallopeptidase
MSLLRPLQLALFGRLLNAPQERVLPIKPIKRSKTIGLHKTLNDEFSTLFSELCQSISIFRHYDLSRVIVSVGASRSRGKTGIWAYVTPLRYVGGGLHRKGRRYGMPGFYTYALGDRDLNDAASPLYMITVLVPRFFNLSFEERIETLVHELYHLHPDFRGDLRRFPAPHVHHGPTPQAYNRRVRELTQEALSVNPQLAEHHLLKSKSEILTRFKKKRVARPTLKFVPKIMALLLLSVAVSAEAQPRRGQLEPERHWKWPWETQEVNKLDKNDPLVGELLDFDASLEQKHPRFIVSPQEPVILKTAPSEWAADLISVGPQDNFLAYSLDKTGDWVLLRTRRVQGWVPTHKIRIVGQLNAPDLSRGTGIASRPSSGTVSSSTTRDGDPVFLPQGDGSIRDADLLSFDRDLDSVIATRGGPLHEQADPLATRYGSVQPGDRVLILKRSGAGNWSYVRLLLTSEEGWFPSEWLRIDRAPQVRGAGRGLLALDVDGTWGTSGRNWGGGVGAYINLLPTRGQRSPTRLEIGGFYHYFSGESVIFENPNTFETYSLNVQYQLMGGMLRWAGFAQGGFIGGAVELGGVYQVPSGVVTGFDDDVLENSGIREALLPHYGVIVGLRGMISLTSWIQINSGFRANLNSRGNSYWGGVGLSARFF